MSIAGTAGPPHSTDGGATVAEWAKVSSACLQPGGVAVRLCRNMTDTTAVHPRRVLLVSSSVGAGHNQAAAALMAGLKDAGPQVETEFIDALSVVPWWFRLVYAGGYTLLVTRLPRLYGWGYRLNNRPKTPRRTLVERGRLWVERMALRRLRRHVLARRPVLVMATHYLAMPMIGRLIGRGAARLRMFAVITDNEPHRWWFSENVERYFVANQCVAEAIRPWGVEADRITVSGIPIHPKWTAPLDRRRILRDWSLPGDRPIVIVSGGTYFTVGPIREIARGILHNTEAHVIVLTGNDKKLQAELAELSGEAGRIKPVGFTDRVHELAEVAALFVTKPGGLMTAECMAKGVPMVLTRPVPGQESANAEMLAREGAAVIAPSTEDVIREVTRLLEMPEALGALAANARRLYRPATETIVSAICQAV